MPDGESRFDVEGDPVERLAHFVLETDKFLNELIDKKYGDGFFYPELYSALVDAWRDSRRHFYDLKRALGNVKEDTLKAHGLTGTELNLKLRVVNFFWKRFKGKPLLTWLEKLLHAINTLLKSLIAATPVGTAAGEIKDEIENCLKADS